MKINTATQQQRIRAIFIFAPFADNEFIETAIKNTVDKNIRIEWYGEFATTNHEKLRIYKNLKIHPLETLPKIPTAIESYLKYKKTLLFLGDINGDLAINQVKEAIVHLSSSKDVPEKDQPSIKAFTETDFPAIEGLSPEMRHLKREVHRVATAGLDKVLLLGDTGTGKEAAAFFLHTLDPIRRKGRFGSINCAVLQEELLISELFGHEKGAFTGATAKKRGLISELNGGTLFLDELPDLPQRTQSMLLRFLESGAYIPLGSTQTQYADTKIISAAQKSLLAEKLKAKQFRQDLYFRIAGKTISLPSLKEIPDDIPSLIVHLAYKIEKNSRKRDDAISYFFDRIDELKRHSWPGNVRELANYINRRVKLGTDEQIDLEEHDLFLGSPDAYSGNELVNQEPQIFNLEIIKKTSNIANYKIDSIDTIKKTYTKHVYESLISQGVSQAQISKLLGVSINTLKKMIT